MVCSTTISYNDKHKVEETVDKLNNIVYTYDYREVDGQLTNCTVTNNANSALGYSKTMRIDEHGSECGEIYALDGTQTYAETYNESTGSLISYSTPIEDIAYSYDGLCRLTTKTRTGSSFSKSITYSYLNNSSNILCICMVGCLLHRTMSRIMVYCQESQAVVLMLMLTLIYGIHVWK